MNVLDFLKSNFLLLDGGMGTLLQEKGLAPGARPEEWNQLHPEIIQMIHQQYFDAGSNVVCTNTFGANSLHFSSNRLEEIICEGIRLARLAAKESIGTQEKFVALDIGPLGRMLAPLGDFPFEDAVSVFAETVRLGVKYGADLILIETMTDLMEVKAALLAAKENSSLPVFVSCAYDERGTLMTGADPGAVIATLEGMGADAVGMNCSLGPKELLPIAEEYLRLSSIPILLKPNAGLPRREDSKTVYDIGEEEFADTVISMAQKGVRILGGCCGTNHSYIKALACRLKDKKPLPIIEKDISCVASYTHAVYFEQDPVLIGERINPTGKKRLKEALKSGDVEYVLSQALAQEEAGAHVLDVNTGLPEINEPRVLSECITAIQSVTALPIQIDTASQEAMEKALRCYNGKAMVNSVNGKAESMEAVFPLVKKYGGFVVALTLDENGIPNDAVGRLAIARKILKKAKEYGLKKKDLIFDPLTLPISASPNSAKVTLEAVRLIREELGCKTVLGVSNVSFGLPSRGRMNASFFTLALQNGLNAAILNVQAPEMMGAYHCHQALFERDENFSQYLEFSAVCEEEKTTFRSLKPTADGVSEGQENLMQAIEKGRKELASQKTQALLTEKSPLTIVEEEIIPALDRVGKGYEEKKVFLPQLLMSAEAAKSAFERIRDAMKCSEGDAKKKGTVLLATVHGDIHDIGKNIVRLLLENYGFCVMDLGKDVPCEKIVEEVVRHHIPLVGLSALMTTTVPAMERTVALLREKAPDCKIMVGGAVLNRDYAERIGADAYGSDAMAAVRIAERYLCQS